MNFTFEGNYKSKRNINLGGNKAQVDKKSLLAKAQSERKAREQERLRWKSALKIQSFFRGRRAAHVIYQQEYSLLQQQLSSLDSLINQPFDSITTATTIITPLVVSCIRQVLLLSHSSRMAYSTCIGKLSQVMISDISIGDKPEKYTVIQLLLLNDLYEMDSKIWLLVLLVGRAILPTLTNEISSEIDVSTTYQALAYLVQLVDPITCSILDKHTSSASLESRGIYIRMMTHLILKDNLFHSLHILLRQLVEYKHMATTMPKTDSHFGMIMNILFSCLDNLQPPYDYPASTIGNLRPPTIHPPTFSSFTNEYTSITFNQTSPPLLLSRQRLLDIFVQEILSVPFLLQDDNGDLLQLVTSKLPIDSILKTILFHYCDDSGDKWQLETDTVAGLLMNLTMLTSYNANGKIQHFLIDYSHVLQTLLCNLPSHYLDDTKDKRNDTRMIVTRIIQMWVTPLQ
ncbi:uncharacterized protein BX664DRAFT_155502 [Halteromyces radiatus]|uniref:uncharacterized protein n=1 Tax=Halteromyces radiatus TaxID=101107 RepID=UPI0022207E57|nr:uncharacterized protein BX664DRAFT_155502 [Halteromyces radiatus]KAI8086326.1 hypothetical protein BX664DRAFT_155502 [Halteromyces radiatus]